MKAVRLRWNNAIPRPPKKGKINQRYCYQCHKYHLTTLEFWFPNDKEPNGVGQKCRLFVPKPKHRKASDPLEPMPGIARILDSFLRNPPGSGT